MGVVYFVIGDGVGGGVYGGGGVLFDGVVGEGVF